MCYVGLNLQKHFWIIGNEISLQMLIENKVPNLGKKKGKGVRTPSGVCGRSLSLFQ